MEWGLWSGDWEWSSSLRHRRGSRGSRGSLVVMEGRATVEEVDMEVDMKMELEEMEEVTARQAPAVPVDREAGDRY